MLLIGLWGRAVHTPTAAECGSEEAIWAAHLAAAGQDRALAVYKPDFVDARRNLAILRPKR